MKYCEYDNGISSYSEASLNLSKSMTNTIEAKSNDFQTLDFFYGIHYFKLFDI